MEARVKFLGHPLHQMLVVMPLGLLSGAMIFDAAHLVFGGEQWALIAYWLIIVGVVSGLGAALFGFLDFTRIPDGTRARRVARLHGLGNVVMVLLFVASWLLRRDTILDPPLLASLLCFAGAGLAGLTGWLGGELVDRMGVGVEDGAHLNAPSSLSGRPAAEGAAAD